MLDVEKTLHYLRLTDGIVKFDLSNGKQKRINIIV